VMPVMRTVLWSDICAFLWFVLRYGGCAAYSARTANIV
jgi:hypothetical protein